MNHIERAITQVESWITSIQEEKDYHAHTLATFSLTAPLRQAAVDRSRGLDVAEGEARELLADLQSKRHRPELMLPRRPMHRMLKIPLRKSTRRAKSA